MISSTVGARFGTASLINTPQSHSIPPLYLHHSAVIRLVNLGALLITGYTLTDPSELRNGPQSHVEASTPVGLTLIGRNGTERNDFCNRLSFAQNKLFKHLAHRPEARECRLEADTEVER